MSSERKEESYRESLNLLREYLSNPKQNVNESMDGKGLSDEVPVKMDEHALGHWRKDDPCGKVVNNFAELCSCSTILCKRGSWKFSFRKPAAILQDNRRIPRRQFRDQ